MRDFFINSLEKIVGVLIILLSIAVVVGAVSIMFTPSIRGGGFLPGIAVFLGGGLYVLVMGGFLYMGLGIYDNTKRTAIAIEKMANKG